ncbi:MAG TPA: hypothetical protein VNV41_06045 [Candidatus Acidoferrales bacterium]|jgi:hypothetical protein|nr:hypothetical protein [Candidatus Acidoferrales bacterium]
MIRRAFVAFLLLLPVFSISSQACTCSQESPGKCPGLQKDDVVFLGTVTAVEDIAYATPRPVDSSDASAKEGAPVDIVAARLTRYHFQIDESFARPDAPGSAAEIDIFSGGDDGDCGYRFQRGQQYVVFTHQGTDNRLFATICSGTRPVAAARALLPQLRAMRNGQRVASVFGVLRRSEPPFLALPEDPDEPLANVSLKLRSRDDRFETSSDSDGVYSFYDVHAGEYSFTALLPVRMELTRKSLTGGLPPFKIPNGACYEYDVDALPTGHIRGSVLGRGGKPLPLASVELYRAGTYDDSRPGLWGFQGAQGVFDLDHVGPGDYVLVFNRANRMDPNAPFLRAFYPGVADLNDARPIKLKDGQQLLNVNMQVGGGYPTRLLRVQVKWHGVRPPGSVTVMAKADSGENPSAQKLGDGLYQFTLLESGNYTLSAWEDLTPRRAAPSRSHADCSPPSRIEAEPVTISGSDADSKSVALTLSSPACDKQTR